MASILVDSRQILVPVDQEGSSLVILKLHCGTATHHHVERERSPKQGIEVVVEGNLKDVIMEILVDLDAGGIQAEHEVARDTQVD